MANTDEYKIDHKFHNILQGEDDLGVVIRVHIAIEQQLNELLGLLCYSFESLDKQTRLSYYQKVCLAEALGLSPEYSGILKVLGNTRNDFAHKPDMEINNSNATKLYDAFSSDGKKVLQRAYNVIRENSKNKVSKSFKKLEPKDKFIFLAVTIHSNLMRKIILTRDSLKSGELKIRCDYGKENQANLPNNFDNESPDGIKWSCPQCGKDYQFEYKFTKS